MNRADIAWLGCAILAPMAHAGLSVGSMDFGGSGGSFGSPITSTGLIYQHPQGDDFPPPAGSLIPGIYFDSYIALDPNGPSSPLYGADAPGGSIPPLGGGSGNPSFFTNFTVSGGFFTAGNVPGGTTNLPHNVAAHVFFARINIAAGHVLFGSNIRVLLGGEGAVALQFALNGPNVVGPSGTRYRIKSYLTDTPVGVAHDLYVEELEVPAPGATAIALCAGVLMSHRRR